MTKLLPRLLRAWRTLEPNDWSYCADAWLPVAARLPQTARLCEISGRILKAAKRNPEALSAFEAAVQRAPQWPGGHIGRGRVLKLMGQRAAAIAAFEAAYQCGAHAAAARELCRYGARDQLPGIIADIYPVRDYAGYIAAHPVPPPHGAHEDIGFAVQIDADLDARTALCDTLDSLLRQVHRDWIVEIVAREGDALRAALAEYRDPRITWTRAHGDQSRPVWRMTLQPGIILDPHALSWFATARATTRCVSVYADHDHYRRTGGYSITRSDPVLQPMFDPIFHAQTAPALLATWWCDADDARALNQDRAALAEAASPIAHVPLCLASLPLAHVERPRNLQPLSQRGESISVIIPTRDNPVMLKACVESLMQTATHGELIEIVIVNNASVKPESYAVFEELATRRNVRVIAFDEPFNWSRANNIAAATCHGAQLLFLNDDTEMLTQGWDAILSGLLASDPAIGIIGSHLQYPDTTTQHAGFVFGMDNGPQHEARWMPRALHGPDDRWNRMHQTVAVTGAFMAMRTPVYAALSGFDEQRFAIDFSDVDICLRARGQGLRVVYAPQISLLHHESVSRGFNVSRTQRTRAATEARTLRAIWGDALDFDPGYNPRWTRVGCSFDGYRALTPDEVVGYIERSATPNPWRLSR